MGTMSAKVHVELVTVCLQLHVTFVTCLSATWVSIYMLFVQPSCYVTRQLWACSLSPGCLAAWLPGCQACELVARLGVWFRLTLSASLSLVVCPCCQSTSCLPPVCP